MPSYVRTGFRSYVRGFDAITATSLTASGAVTAASLVGDIGVTRNPGPMIAGDTGTLTTASGRAYCQYVGRVPKALTSADVHYYLSGTNAVAGAGGASVNWAEAAIATGTLSSGMDSSPTLTVLGYTSISASVTAAATEWRSVTVTATIPANTDLWVVIAAAYETTQPTFRIPVNWVNARGYAGTRNAFQPSANIGSPLDFTAGVTTGTVVPFMSMQWL